MDRLRAKALWVRWQVYSSNKDEMESKNIMELAVEQDFCANAALIEAASSTSTFK